MKLIDDAVQALSALLETSAPPEGTQSGGKGLLAPIVEVLEQPQGTDTPHEHLFGSTIKTLEKSNTEEKEK